MQHSIAPALGTVAASEQLLFDLYVRLRADLRKWSNITFQTPQARMGYVGQHLTSVVTGYRGGRSGARGKDLVLPDGSYAEIKTCTRVDQLGKCNACDAPVASIEQACSECGSTKLKRNDDSKWLIGIRHDDELRQLFDPQWYYLVLFDFADFAQAADINARIYRVDPRQRGFAYCMVDYYFNIRARSTSKAPFNLWPFQLKFYLMKPELIYHSVIGAKDTISTLIFPGRDHPQPIPLPSLVEFSRASNLSDAAIDALRDRFGVRLASGSSKAVCLDILQRTRLADRWSDEELADVLAEGLYRDGITGHEEWLPAELR